MSCVPVEEGRERGKQFIEGRREAGKHFHRGREGDKVFTGRQTLIFIEGGKQTVQKERGKYFIGRVCRANSVYMSVIKSFHP